MIAKTRRNLLHVALLIVASSCGALEGTRGKDATSPPQDQRHSPAASDQESDDATTPTGADHGPGGLAPASPDGSGGTPTLPDRFAAGLYFATSAAGDPSYGALARLSDAPNSGSALVVGVKPLPTSGFSLGSDVLVTFEPSPTGGSAATLVVQSADAKSRRVYLLPSLVKPARPAISPDATEVAFEARTLAASGAAAKAAIYILDLEHGAFRVAAQGGDAHAPVWMPTSHRLAFVRFNSPGGPADLCVTDASDPRTLACASGAGGPQLAVSPDEAEIFVASTGKSYSAHDLTPRRDIALALASGASAAGLAKFQPLTATYAPDGELVIAGITATSDAYLVRADRDGAEVTIALGPVGLPVGSEGSVKSLDASFSWAK